MRVVIHGDMECNSCAGFGPGPGDIRSYENVPSLFCDYCLQENSKHRKLLSVSFCRINNLIIL